MRAILLLGTVLTLVASSAEARRHQASQPQAPVWNVQPMPFYEPLRQSRRIARHRHRVGSTNRRASNCRGDCKRPPIASGLITIPTAAGISITVNPSFAPKIAAFIQDLVASGYKPKQIHCAASHGHVRGSRHYAGAACDIDQRGYGKTAPRMYHVAELASRHGLRDGGSFRDWGHIDDGEPLNRTARVRVARKPDPMIYATAAQPW